MSEKVRLFDIVSDAQYLSKLSLDDISLIVKRKLHGGYNGKKHLQDASREAAIFTSKNIKFVTCKDIDYPQKLLDSSNPPFALFYKGDLSLLHGEKLISVVGTRYVTPHASSMAKRFAYDAVNDGCTVVSGLANGVDGAAHSGALDAYFDALESGKCVKAKTVGVLPCSVDTVTPRNHSKLASDILMAGGCLISETTPLTEIKKWNFATRNRIIAALTPATLVVQAPNGSGALITANYAIEYGRALFFHTAAFSEQALAIERAVFTQLEKDYSIGKVPRSKLENCCKKFIDGGALVVSSYSDYLNHMEIIAHSRPKPPVKTSQASLFDDIF